MEDPARTLTAASAFTLSWGLQDEFLDAHPRFAVAVGATRGLLSAVTLGAIRPVAPSYVEVHSTPEGTLLRRWELDSEEFSPVSTMTALVKSLQADLQTMDAATFRDRYADHPPTTMT